MEVRGNSQTIKILPISLKLMIITRIMQLNFEGFSKSKDEKNRYIFFSRNSYSRSGYDAVITVTVTRIRSIIPSIRLCKIKVGWLYTYTFKKRASSSLVKRYWAVGLCSHIHYYLSSNHTTNIYIQIIATSRLATNEPRREV